MKSGDEGEKRGQRRDGKRSACRVLFSGVGKAGERQARTAARDAEYERWGWLEQAGGGKGRRVVIIDAGSIDASILHYCRP